MKVKIISAFTALTLAILYLFFPANVKASELGTSPTAISGSDKIHTIEHLKISFSTQPSSDRGTIGYYNISEQGYIAVCFSDDKIAVYDDHANFLYEYSFDVDGLFTVMWNDADIVLIACRAALAVELNASGDVVALSKIDTNENNWYSMTSKIPSHNGYIYEKKHKQEFFDDEITTYIVKRSLQDNSETVIIEAKSTSIPPFIYKVCFPLGLLLLICVIVFAISGNTGKRKLHF